MHSKHGTPSIVPQKPIYKDLRHRVGFNPFNATTLERKSTDTHSADLEKDEKGLPVLARFPMLDLNHYKMVNEVWHYYSVDWGTNCRSFITISSETWLTIKDLCIGYNSISDTDGNQELSSEDVQDTSGTLDDNAETTERSGNNPHGARTWTWLVLTDDGIDPIHFKPQIEYSYPIRNDYFDVRRSISWASGRIKREAKGSRSTHAAEFVQCLHTAVECQ